MFEHYWIGGGTYTLSLQRFIAIVTWAGKAGAENLPELRTKFNGQDAIARNVSFYASPEYSLAFGTATIYYDLNNDPIGFYDVYNFDAKDWGTRSFSNEVKTRMVLGASVFSNAIPFIIKFP